MRKLIIAAAAALLLPLAASAAGAYHVVRRIPLADGGWDLLSYDPAARRVYLARTDGVDSIDPDSGRVTRLAGAARSHAALAIGEDQVLVTDGGTNTARFLSARSGQELAAVPVGQGPDAAVIDPATGLALVMSPGSGEITLIEPRSHAVRAILQVGGSLELAVADGKGRVFVNIEDRNQLAVIDVAARSVRTAELGGCDGPTGIAWLPLAHRVLSTCGNGVAALTDPDALRLDRTLPIGEGPDTALYDPARRLALVPCGRSGELYLFRDGPTVTAEGSVVTQRGARTGAIDPASGRVFLPAAEFEAPSSPGGRPQLRPGSVTLLVMAP